jgi:hypothetical protein
MSRPFKLKKKDARGHRLWAAKTDYGHTTFCRALGCPEPPREVRKR